MCSKREVGNVGSTIDRAVGTQLAIRADNGDMRRTEKPEIFEPLLFANVPLSTYDYTAHGDGSEFTVRRNRRAFEWVDLLPGKAVDPKSVDLSTDLFGASLKFPILVAPSAVQVPLHPDGEIGMYRGAVAASNTTMILSQNTSIALDRVAAGAAGSLWMQFYPQRILETSQQNFERAQAAGCRAIVITVDQQASIYERTLQDRNLGGNPRGPGRGGGAAATSGPALYRVSESRLWYTWQYLDHARKIIKVPMVVKGILTTEDALLCIEHGADGIIVSNHGGRSMDYGPSTLEVLPEIVAAVNGRIAVITDSGYRHGRDVLKALALGANAVMLGRAPRWALGAFGTPGVQRLLEIVQQELVDAAAAAGRTTRASIDKTLVRTRFS
jgi:isopentenyl diphosphate isomerase/L-lactate dehydrogenase-like FMN-dependent dehydrogenase